MVPVCDDTYGSQWSQLRQWFSEPVGEALLHLEAEQLRQMLPDLFGYHLVQIGFLGGGQLLESSRISHRIVWDLGPLTKPAHLPLCDASALPLATQSVDVVVLPHVLEFQADPHIVLRESERVLIGEGHILVLGFNPLSWFGLWRLALAHRGIAPWNGRFLGVERVKEWLHVLGFDILETRFVYFRPPVGARWCYDHLRFVENIGQFLCPILGGVYVVLGRKRLLTLTPLNQRWRKRRVAIKGVVGQPTCMTADD